MKAFVIAASLLASSQAVAQVGRMPPPVDESSVCTRTFAIPEEAADQVSLTLDVLHSCAATARAEAYFNLFTPTAVFIGTDVSERWTLSQFRTYAEPIFRQGRGWTYTLRPGTRHVAVSADGQLAWFDEVLDSASYGTSRGTGVLVLTPRGWRIAQYHLTFPIPNALAPEFTRRIREHEGRALTR